MYINDINSNEGKYCLSFTSMSSCSDSGNLPSVVIFYSSDKDKISKICWDYPHYTFNILLATCKENYDREIIETL